MQVTKKDISETKLQLDISAGSTDLAPYKNKVLDKLSTQVNIPGFRGGKAPHNLVEKHADQTTLQNEFMDQALTGLYQSAVKQEKLQPAGRPEVSVNKLVPYTALEFTVTVDVVKLGELPEYKNIKAEKPSVNVEDKDVEQVVDQLRTQAAKKTEVQRAAKQGDQAYIDFMGADTQGQPIKGAEGSDYPMLLGSKAFIPGFEEKIVGMKPGDKKEFTLTFPEDYQVSGMANKKVKFTVTLKKVEELDKPAVDDTFAASLGPFKDIAQLKTGIKQQITQEREAQARQQYTNQLIGRIAEQTEAKIPKGMAEHQAKHNLDELKQNLSQKGQTYEDFLKSQNTTEDGYFQDTLIPRAEQQIKTGLILGEIAEKENITVSKQEVETRIDMLKGQYKDTKTQAELDKPQVQRDIASRILSEKVISKLEEYASK